MVANPQVITDNLNLWTSVLLTKSTAGRSNGGRVEAYGIKKLRELILELAVRGKLVPQDPDDEPASVLLGKIAIERKRLAKEGNIKKPKELPEISAEERPFVLPRGWGYVRLNDLGEWGAGATPSRSRHDYYGGDIPWFKSGELVDDYISESEELVTELALKETSLRYNKPGDVLIAMYGATIGKTSILNFAATTNQAVCACTPFNGFANIFLLTLLKAYKNRFVEQGAGGAQPNISREKIIATVIALPPTAEQHRIVAKVDELMALCDQLEQQQTNSIEAHQTLVETLLGTLTSAASHKEFAAAWTRIADHFDTLFTTEQSIDQLKQTILQLAVMGKLVPQEPNDEPASVLLDEVAREKERLVKKGLLKKEKPLPPVTDEEMTFRLPNGWAWSKFGVIAEFINGDRSKNYPNRSEYVDDGVAWINTGHIEPSGRLTTHDMNFISREKFDSLNSGKIRKGDLVYCLRGATFGKTAFVEPYEEGAIASSLMIIRPFILGLTKYIFQYLVSPFGKQQLFRFDNGSAQPNLSAGNVMLYVFPLPPLAEQHRIVAKVDELMALCDALKARLAAAQTTQIHLADAIVEQAVA